MEKRESVAALLCMGRTPKQISMDLDIGLMLIYKVKKLVQRLVKTAGGKSLTLLKRPLVSARDQPSTGRALYAAFKQYKIGGGWPNCVLQRRKNF